MSETETNNKRRAPIVAILGHVDHGKTTILDKIREADVCSTEVGGITQKISVFTINPDCQEDKSITFIDTPGHEAFDLMRLRGGNVADIVLLIIAADDGVMPQTKESIEIIKNSKAKPIVVINKCDLPNIDIPKIKRELLSFGLIPEEMGGKVPVVEVSGKTGKGIKELLEMINLLIDVEGLQQRDALPENILGRAVVLESFKDKTKGYIASIVDIQGSMKKGDFIAYKVGNTVTTDKIKGFISEDGQNIDILSEGYGGKIIGLAGILELGSEILVINEKDKRNAENIFSSFQKKVDVETAPEAEQVVLSQDELLASFFATPATDNKKKKLNIILKSSTEGSLEAIIKSLEKIQSEEVDVVIQSKEVGDITQKDVDTAEVTRSIILGFEVGMEQNVRDLADKKKVLIRNYEIIYKLVDEIADTVDMLEHGQEVEEELGNAEVKAIFILSNGSKVIGCRVRDGLIKRGERCYFVRGDDIVAKGRIESMKHEKSEIKESRVGDDFGAIVDPTPEDIKEGDMLFCFKVVK